MCVGLVTSVYANSPGDVLGDVLYSDIVAYINGHAIPTSITEGRAMVVAEDLRNYGFDVVWNGDDFTLSIEYTGGGIDPLPVEANTAPVGTFKCHYVYTAIKTYLSGELVDSFAIDGQTLIDFELLAKYGDITWNGEERSLRLTIAAPAPAVVTAPEPVPTAAAAYNPSLNTVEFKLLEHEIMVNGRESRLDVVAITIDQDNNNIYFPVSEMAKALGIDVEDNIIDFGFGLHQYDVTINIPGMKIEFEWSSSDRPHFVYYINDIPYPMEDKGTPLRTYFFDPGKLLAVRAEFFVQALGIEWFYNKDTETHIFNPKEPLAANMADLTPPLRVAPDFGSIKINNLVLWSPQNRDITVVADSVTAPFGSRGRLCIVDDKGNEFAFNNGNVITLEMLYGNGHGIRIAHSFPNGTYRARVDYYGVSIYSAPLTINYTATGKLDAPKVSLDRADTNDKNVMFMLGLERGIPFTMYITDLKGDRVPGDIWLGTATISDRNPNAERYWFEPLFDFHPGYKLHIQYTDTRTHMASDWTVIEIKAENIGGYNQR